MEKPNLLSLPTEIQLGILGSLSSREIVQTRRVCRNFRNLLDDPGNRTALVKVIEDRARKRLNCEYTRIVQLDTKATPFLTAMADHIAFRGISIRSDARRLVLTAVSSLVWKDIGSTR